VLAVVGGVVVWVAASSVFLGLVVAVGIPVALTVVVQGAAGRERRRFEGQLPDTLNLMATSLRAGYSLQQALEAVSGRAAAPTNREFGRVMAEIRLGRQVPDALRGIAARMGSVDFAWAVMAIEIQRDVGGNLAEVLNSAASTLVERTRLRREARALTSEGRLTAGILTAVPFLLFAFLFAANRDYLDPLLDETLGKVALVATAGLMGVGIFWLRRIVNIEV
jgi:tight adherence protein B